jgi:hypothetical protein
MQFLQPSITLSLLQSCPYIYHKVIWKERRYNLHSFLILVLDGGGWSASCPRQLYPGGKEHLCIVNGRLGGPQSRSRPFIRRETSLASAGLRTTDHPVHSLFTIRAMLSQLPNIPQSTAFSRALYALSIISFVSFNHHYIPSNEHHSAGHWTYLHHQVKGKHTHTGVLISSWPHKEGNKLQRQKILLFIYPIYNHKWRNISTIYIHNKTSIKQNILTLKQNTSGSRSG